MNHIDTIKNHNAHGRLEKVLHYLLLIAAGLYFLLFIAIALARIAYPYALEWAEGGMLDHVYRILQGKPLYVAPSLDFTPYTYTPLYFYLSAGLAKIIGLSFVPLRLISLLATLGCFCLIFLFVYRETGCRYCGFLAAALYAASFHVCGDWYDIGRVDSLLLFFLLWGFFLFRFKQNKLSMLVTALLFLIAFWIKQTALVISLPFLLYSLLPSQIRVRWLFVVFYLLTLVTSLLFMQSQTKGWFFYYVFYLPRFHPLMPELFYQFWLRYLIRPHAIALAVALFFLTNMRKQQLQIALFYAVAVLAFVGGVWIAAIPSGSYHNVAMPAIAMAAILFGVGLHWFRRKFKEVSLFIVIMLFLQFLGLLYNPLRAIPTQKDRAAADDFTQRLRQMEEPVFLPSHNYLLRMVDKGSCAHMLALADALRDDRSPRGVRLRQEISSTISEKHFRTIILDEPWFPELIDQHYNLSGRVFMDSDVYWPLIGFQTRPEYLYHAK